MNNREYEADVKDEITQEITARNKQFYLIESFEQVNPNINEILKKIRLRRISVFIIHGQHKIVMVVVAVMMVAMKNHETMVTPTTGFKSGFGS